MMANNDDDAANKTEDPLSLATKPWESKVVAGLNGQLELYSDKIVIKRNGLLASFVGGPKDGKEIPLTSLISVKFQEATTFADGYIHFRIIGNPDFVLINRSAAIRDENTVTFLKSQEPAIVEIKHAIRKTCNASIQGSSPVEERKNETAPAEVKRLGTREPRTANGLTAEVKKPAGKPVPVFYFLTGIVVLVTFYGYLLNGFSQIAAILSVGLFIAAYDTLFIKSWRTQGVLIIIAAFVLFVVNLIVVDTRWAESESASKSGKSITNNVSAEQRQESSTNQASQNGIASPAKGSQQSSQASPDSLRQPSENAPGATEQNNIALTEQAQGSAPQTEQKGIQSPVSAPYAQPAVDPDKTISEVLQAQSSSNEDSFNRALSTLSMLPKRWQGDVKKASQLNQLGLKKLKEKDFHAAANYFDQASKADPGDAKFLSNQGFAEMNAGDLISAERHLHESIALNPSRSIAWNDLGLVLAKKGDQENAVASLLVAYRLSTADSGPKYLQSLGDDDDPAVRSAGSEALRISVASATPSLVVSEPPATRLGQSSITTITNISTELEGNPEYATGYAVSYANGVYSDKKIPELLGARVGDAVELRLMALPSSDPSVRPEGLYQATNLRTHKSWNEVVPLVQATDR